MTKSFTTILSTALILSLLAIQSFAVLIDPQSNSILSIHNISTIPDFHSSVATFDSNQNLSQFFTFNFSGNHKSFVIKYTSTDNNHFRFDGSAPGATPANSKRDFVPFTAQLTQLTPGTPYPTLEANPVLNTNFNQNDTIWSVNNTNVETTNAQAKITVTVSNTALKAALFGDYSATITLVITEVI